MSEFINHLDDALKQRVWDKALARGGDFAEIFIEDTDTLGFQLKDGKVADLSKGRRQGNRREGRSQRCIRIRVDGRL